MSNASAPPKSSSSKRRQGRPVPGLNDVGREAILRATEGLLRRMPPSQVTVARIAKEANVHRALIRYYFGNRTALLVAVVDRVTDHATAIKRKDAPAAALSGHIDKTARFIRSTPFMHRLMIDELVQAGTDDTRASVRKFNLDLIGFYRDLMIEDAGQNLVDIDPILLHFVILGVCDFFSQGEPVIQEIVEDSNTVEDLYEKLPEFLVNLLMNGLLRR